MSIFGINGQNELQQFNLISQDAPDTLTPNVVALHAIYGIDDGSSNMTWQPPTGNYAYSAILTLSRAQKAALLRNIAGIRISMLIKSPYPQSDEITESSITHFADILPSSSIKTDIAENDRKYRHELLEFTIPLRNALFARDLVNPPG